MTPREQAAVEAAVVAVRAHRRRNGTASRSAAEVLSARLDGLEWSSFHGRGYELLREVLRRVNGSREPEGGTPEFPWEAGAKYEDRYSPARERIVRAL